MALELQHQPMPFGMEIRTTRAAPPLGEARRDPFRGCLRQAQRLSAGTRRISPSLVPNSVSASSAGPARAVCEADPSSLTPEPASPVAYALLGSFSGGALRWR